MKAYYSTTEVAQEFEVTDETVRAWIEGHRLMAIRPGGRYKVPAAALEVFRRQATVRRATPVGAGQASVSLLSLDELYRDRIEPVLRETGMTADQLIREMAHDATLVIRFPSFAGDYSVYVSGISTAVGSESEARHAGV